MSKMTEKDLRRRDAKRNIGEELLRAVQEMKAGKAARVHRIPVSAITEARTRTGLSQARFAQLLGVSTRTLQEWEQGRRSPSGAARTLLLIAARNPKALLDALPTYEADDGPLTRDSLSRVKATAKAHAPRGKVIR